MDDTEKTSEYSNFDPQSSHNNDNQAESCRNVIIVNQLPDNIDSNKLLSIFSEFGQIDNVYISMEKRKLDSDEAYNHEFARITYNSEEEAANVAKAFQEGKIKYNEHSLMITQTAEDCCLIENLPDLCLIEILKCLTDPQDKLNCELVSKRWNKLAKESWSNITEASTMENVDKIVRRAGKYLRNVALDFDYKQDELQDILILLVENCERIENFNCYPSYMPSAMDFSLLKSIIERNKNLRSLELQFELITNDMLISFINLMDVFPTALEKLVIIVTTEYSAAKYVWDVFEFKNLQILILKNVEVEISGIENLLNLKHLEILYCGLMDLSGIKHLTNLEYFSTAGSSIRDGDFEGMLRNNQKLKFLEILWNGAITDASFQYVQQLPELKVLIMTTLSNISETYISNMSSVRFVSFAFCRQITDRAFKQFLDTANEIEIIIALYTQLTVDSIRIANEWTKRTGKPLTFYVDSRIGNQFVFLDIEIDAKLHLKREGDDDFVVDMRNDTKIYKKRYSLVWPPP